MNLRQKQKQLNEESLTGQLKARKMDLPANDNDFVFMMFSMIKNRRFRVEPLWQSRDREGKFHLLLEELELYHGRHV